MRRWLAVLALAAAMLHPGWAQDYTRGIGIYPGDPKEDFSPRLKNDGVYRNLALRRPAYQSSAYDYNLTAQLITDGITETRPPRWIGVATSPQATQVSLSTRLGAPPLEIETSKPSAWMRKNTREYILDDNWTTGINLVGCNAWVQVELGGEALQVDQIEIQGRVLNEKQPENWACFISGSEDGKTWVKLGQATDLALPGGLLKPSIAFGKMVSYRHYRLDLQDARAEGWTISELRFFQKGKRVPVGGPYVFSSAWMSQGSGTEWVYVDLGASCSIDRVVLSWLRRATEGSLQVSDDAQNWKTVQALPSGGVKDDLKFSTRKARYVRLMMTKASSNEGYVLSELEVYGKGGPVAQPKPSPAPGAEGRVDLAGGGWRVQRDSFLNADGATLSTVGFKADDWIVATVPGTVLTSYLNAGALPNPNFGDNQLAISDSFFHADFWYRDEFVAPAAEAGKRMWLNFDGINWKAEIFLNGHALGSIEGAFLRKHFDVTEYLLPGKPNALAVKLLKNATPGSVREKTLQSPDKNGGPLGTDNPTYHASIGWDWIPTIRGRNTGLWNKVYLTQTGAVSVEDPSVTTVLPLPETSSADVSISVNLRNHTSQKVTGTLKGKFGDIAFEARAALEPNAVKVVKLDPLHFQNPKLWWPAGYGDPNLYPVELKFVATDGVTSDVKRFQAGIRQFTYRIDPAVSNTPNSRTLTMWINGRHFIPKGGNWGFPESMLLYRGREYQAAVRYHADMHFNMIRNWVGQTGDDEFYEACDRNGVVVWQDFWLANPWDGDDPSDSAMFLANTDDYIRRIRTHPSMGLYCGRNEGYPPRVIDDGIRALLKELHSDLPYISSSADDEVNGHGPYASLPAEYYFNRPLAKIHSEMGMANVMTLDSVKLTMAPSDQWPFNHVWGLHDFTLGGAQSLSTVINAIEKNYGHVDNVADWLTLAQFVNYDCHRAMFEAQSARRAGLLMWMSHPCWPSFVWQTYDYFLEPTAGYFGLKKACEPLHIQWNAMSGMVEVVNYSGGPAKGLSAAAQVIDLEGKVRWEQTVVVDSMEDSTLQAMAIEYPLGLSPVYFIRLKLSRGAEQVSENTYCRGMEDGDLKGLRKLPKARMSSSTKAERKGEIWTLTTELKNLSSTPVLGVRLKAVREKSGDRILPTLYSDNYVVLMPGESRILVTEMQHADTRGERPMLRIEGFNVGEVVNASRF